jgi:hypothetical protein
MSSSRAAGMLFVVTHGGNAYPTRNFAKQKVVRKTFQISPSTLTTRQVEQPWINGRLPDE